MFRKVPGVPGISGTPPSRNFLSTSKLLQDAELKDSGKWTKNESGHDAENFDDSVNEGITYMKLDYLNDKARNRKVTKKLDVNYKAPTERTKLKVQKFDEKIKSANKYHKRAILTAYNPKTFRNNTLSSLNEETAASKKSKEHGICSTLAKAGVNC